MLRSGIAGRGHKYLCQLELDVTPVADHWLDKLIEGIEIEYTKNKFWMLGAGVEREMFPVKVKTLNGNAVYTILDPAFMQFVRGYYKWHRDTKSGKGAFDTLMPIYANIAGVDLSTKLVISPLLVNCDMYGMHECVGRSPDDTSPQKWMPVQQQTVLVHAKHVDTKDWPLIRGKVVWLRAGGRGIWDCRAAKVGSQEGGTTKEVTFDVPARYLW